MTCGPPLEEQENFDSPVLRRLLETWDDYEHEEIDEEDVLDVLDRIEALTREQVESLDESAKLPDVDILNPNRIGIHQAFLDHLIAVEKMRGFFYEDKPELVDQAFEIIQHATNQLVKGMEGLLTEKDLPRKLCFHCSEPNLRNARKCVSCFAQLPVIEHHEEKKLLAVAGPEYQVHESAKSTPNYIEMANAYDDWLFEEISNQEFLAIAQQIRKRYLTEYTRSQESLELARGQETENHLLTQVEALGEHLDIMDWMIKSFEENYFLQVEQAMHRLDQASNDLVALGA
ncbi:MAG: hypothetical protein WC314_15830 [Vulcanimicrobiota bacterium]